MKWNACLPMRIASETFSCFSVSLHQSIFIYSFVREFRRATKTFQKEDNRVNFINHLPKEATQTNILSFLPTTESRKSNFSQRRCYSKLTMLFTLSIFHSMLLSREMWNHKALLLRIDLNN